MFSLFIRHCGASCGQRPLFLLCTRCEWRSPGSGGVIRDWVCGNPQLSPACTQDRRHFAQVIHRLVHRNRVREPAAGLGAATAPQRCPRHRRPARCRLAAGHRMPHAAGPRWPRGRCHWRACWRSARSRTCCRRGSFADPTPAGTMTKATHERHNSRRARPGVAPTARSITVPRRAQPGKAFRLGEHRLDSGASGGYGPGGHGRLPGRAEAREG